nr:hypothetical protein Hi04_10k_c361_00006 [uncultured bacterium]
MNAGIWIGLLSPAIALCGTAIMATVKMTRLVDAVERLSGSMEKIAGQVSDHEHRLTKGGL